MRKTSISMNDLSIQKRPQSASSTKHSRPISAASLSESLHALSSPSPQPQSRSNSRQRSSTLTEILDDQPMNFQSPLSKTTGYVHGQYGSSESDDKLQQGRMRSYTDGSLRSSESPLMHAKSRVSAATSTPKVAGGKQHSDMQRFNPLSNSPHFTRNPLFRNSPNVNRTFGISPASHSPAALQRQRIAVESGYAPQDSPYMRQKAAHTPLSPSIWGSETLARFQSMPVLGQGNASTFGHQSPQLKHTVGRQSDMDSSTGQLHRLTNTMTRFGPNIQTAAQRVAARQKCKCSPDPALAPGFSLLEIT